MLDTIKLHIKTSLLAGDRFRAETLKLVQAALMNAKIAKMASLSPEEEISVVQKEIKKRKEAITMYESAGYSDRADQEARELTILNEFVPTLLEGKELETAVQGLVSQGTFSGLNFADAMKLSIEKLGNVDKGQLAGLLKTKL